MIAVDTNVVVRLLTLDDAEQSRKARRLFRDRGTYIMTNVAMETEWVLRTSYKFSRERIAAGFELLFGLSTVTLERPELMAAALSGLRSGLDFADAIHLLGAADAGVAEFASFDKSLRTRAKRLEASIEVVAP